MTKRLTGSITITILLILTLAASIKALVQANNVDKKDIMEVEVVIENLKVFSNDKLQENNKFSDGGMATLVDNNIAVTSMKTNDKIEFDIKGNNKSNVKVKYRYVIEYSDGENLVKNMIISSDEYTSEGMTYVSNWNMLEIDKDAEKKHFTISLKEAIDSSKSILKCKIEAVKESETTNNPILDGVNLYNISDLLKFKESLKADEKYQTKKVALLSDYDLQKIVWEPLTTFKGTFDGGNHTIKNLNIKNDLAYGNGFFKDVRDGAVIKDVKFENATISRKSSTEKHYSGNVYGIVVGYAYGNVELNNVSVISSTITGYGKIAPLIGMAADKNGTTKITNCTIKANTIKAAYNAANIIGLAQNEVLLKDNVIENNEWIKDQTVVYTELDTTLVKDNTIIVKGLYMKYESDGDVYYYSAWGKAYNDYKNVDDELKSGGKLVGFSHN